jgi:hypothetical protein
MMRACAAAADCGLELWQHNEDNNDDDGGRLLIRIVYKERMGSEITTNLAPTWNNID